MAPSPSTSKGKSKAEKTPEIDRKIEENKKDCMANDEAVSSSCASRQPDEGSFFYKRDRMIQEFGKFVILNEMPFTLGENEAFEQFVKVSLQPAFKRIPKNILTKQSLSSYGTSVSNLTELFQKLEGHVSLTIGFELVVESELGDSIRVKILHILEKFGLQKRIFSICLGNASANTKYIEYLLGELQPMLKGIFFQVRCCAFVIDLCARRAIHHLEPLISSIRDVVKWTKYSSQKRPAFHELCKKEGLKPMVFYLDSPDCWSSCHKFLIDAYEYREILTKVYNESNSNFGSHQSIVESQWNMAKSIIDVLTVFSNAIKTFASLNEPNVHVVIRESIKIVKVMSDYEKDHLLMHCISDMKSKWLEYFSEFPLLYAVATVFDPFIKLDGLSYLLEYYYETLGIEYDVQNYISTCKDALNALFAHYSSKYEVQTSSRSSQVGIDPLYMELMMKMGRCDNSILELDYYLTRQVDLFDCSKSNMLQWWNQRVKRFPILSKIVKDIFSSPTSTVASESAFTAGKRVLDKKDSRFKPDLIRACISNKDWNAAEKWMQGERV